MAVVTKIDVSLDLQHPVREVSDVITLILSMYPGREIEILSQIDDEVGAELARLTKAQEDASQDVEADTDKPE